MRVIRVLFVDDHPVVRSGLSALISAEEDMAVAGEATSGREAAEMFRACRPDVTLMDLRLPDWSGVEATAAIRTQFPDARIIVLSSYGGGEDIRRAVEAGASGYLLKESLRTDLLNAIRAVHAGQQSFPREVGERLAASLWHPRMTDREMEVLEQMTKGFRNRNIAATLAISEETVKVHVKNILAKLKAADRTQAILIALRRSLVRLD
jgi:two-component system NarL family response regulator